MRIGFWFRVVVRWFRLIGRESPAGGRFGPVYAWHVALAWADVEPLQRKHEDRAT